MGTGLILAPAPPSPPEGAHPELLDHLLTLVRRAWPEIAAIAAAAAAAATRYRKYLLEALRRLLALSPASPPPASSSPASPAEPRPPNPGVASFVDPTILARIEERQRQQEANEQTDRLLENIRAMADRNLEATNKGLQVILEAQRGIVQEMEAARSARREELRELRRLVAELRKLILAKLKD